MQPSEVQSSSVSVALVTYQITYHNNSTVKMFEIESMPDLLKSCGMVFPANHARYFWSHLLVRDALNKKQDQKVYRCD